MYGCDCAGRGDTTSKYFYVHVYNRARCGVPHPNFLFFMLYVITALCAGTASGFLIFHVICQFFMLSMWSLYTYDDIVLLILCDGKSFNTWNEVIFAFYGVEISVATLESYFKHYCRFWSWINNYVRFCDHHKQIVLYWWIRISCDCQVAWHKMKSFKLQVPWIFFTSWFNMFGTSLWNLVGFGHVVCEVCLFYFYICHLKIRTYL